MHGSGAPPHFPFHNAFRYNVTMMRSLVRLTIILALCVMTIGVLTAPVEAVCRYPEISLSTEQGLPGDSITVSGKDLDPDGYVDIYYYLDSDYRVPLKEDIIPTVSRKFEVDVVIPESPAGAYTLRAIGQVDGQVVELDAIFRVIPGVIVDPTTGPIGAEITVSGRGFAANETGIEVRRGLYDTIVHNIEADARGNWEATFSLPAWSQGEHEIRARGSVHAIIQGVRPAVFRVGPGITVAGESGAVGQTIAVSGTGFGANERNIRILIGGKVLITIPAIISADATGRWEAVFVVPEKPAGEYSVTAEGDRTRQTDIDGVPFEIRPALKLSPEEGHVGTDLTVEGLGFAASKDVAIIYDGSEVARVTTDADGTFEVVFSVPESRRGEQKVKAGIMGETNSISDLITNTSAVFMMESDPPPIPEPLSPGDGGRVGFFRSGTPTFEWDEVFDLSGVYYGLKVATSPDFEAESIVFSATELTVTSFTPTEAMPNGSYYWAVQAVDGAENESAWSDVQRIRVGRLPMWGFIVIFSFIGLLLGLRAYFILVRPRLYE